MKQRLLSALVSSSLTLALLMTAGPLAHAVDITVEVTGINEARGHVLVSAFDKNEAWLKRAVQTANVPAQAGKVIVTFTNLAEGDYALSAVHDINANGKLDTNLLGIPSEPYGFSNNAMGRFGPPAFEAASVKVGADNTRFQIKLH